MDKHRTGGVDRGTVIAYSIVSDVIAGQPIKISTKDIKDNAASGAAQPTGPPKALAKAPAPEVLQRNNLASVQGEQLHTIVCVCGGVGLGLGWGWV